MYSQLKDFTLISLLSIDSLIDSLNDLKAMQLTDNQRLCTHTHRHTQVLLKDFIQREREIGERERGRER